MDSCVPETSTGSGCESDYPAGVRLVVLNLPEDEGEGLGFRLTRTLWDPYPWVHEVVPGARADNAGLTTGDCLLQADGKDLLGLPVGQVAGLIRGDGASRGVSLLVWNCGVDPKDDPELLWSCGGGTRGERSRRALAGVVRALACCVCAATATRALSCARSHLYCEGCWSRLQRCALCREQLPPKESPYARNLVAEQVFEAIAAEYELKNTIKRPRESISACTSPNRSPGLSPAPVRKGQNRLSTLNTNISQGNVKYRSNFASDPNIHRSTNQNNHVSSPVTNPTITNTSNTENNCQCICQSKINVPQNVQTVDSKFEGEEGCLQHKLVTRLRQACSLADLSYQQRQSSITGSLNNINVSEHCVKKCHRSSLDSLKVSGHACDAQPVFVLSPPPIYVVTCDHSVNN